MSLKIKNNTEFLQEEIINEYHKEHRKDLILVLVTRKGYWVYKYFEERIRKTG